MPEPLPTRPFEVAARHRPIALVGHAAVDERYDRPPAADTRPTPQPAPYAAIEIDLATPRPRQVRAELIGPDGSRIAARLRGRAVDLTVTSASDEVRHRSLRHGRAGRPDRLALSLTGTHATAFTHEDGNWVARARTDLSDRIDTRDPGWLAGLTSGWESTDPSEVVGWRAGSFGQLGLRDLRLVTHADGTPHRDGRQVLLTATSAGPGFFGTAHTSVWRLDPRDLALHHCSDLFFTRPTGAGVYGDHATHLLREDDRWLVATSTWGDFDPAEDDAGVSVTLAESTADLLTGQHVLPSRHLPLPTEGLVSVGVWDPHLVHHGDRWLVGFVSARKFFDFHPALAVGPDLDHLSRQGAATDRRETEGTTLLHTPDGWRALASDGPRNPRPLRRRYPVFDERLRETGTLAAPYLSNIGWPTIVGLDKLDQHEDELDQHEDEWLMVTFDGTPYGGRLPGYGTHGDVVVLRSARP